MAEHLVKWKVKIKAETAEKAEKIAFDMQRDSFSNATVFTVDRKSYPTETIYLEW